MYFWLYKYLIAAIRITDVIINQFLAPDNQDLLSLNWCAYEESANLVMANYTEALGVVHKLRWQVFGFFYLLPTSVDSFYLIE